MKTIGIVVIVVVIAFILGCGQHKDEYEQEIVDLTGQPPEVAYVALKCAKCHGAELEGQRTAPKLTGLKNRWSQDELMAYLRDPQAVVAVTPRLAYMAERYAIAMPAYAHTDEQVLQGLATYLLAN